MPRSVERVAWLAIIGHLAVLTARMNPNLAMAEELLKKTRTGNLFSVFGQPDIDEAAWASLNSTDSRPFPRPDSGRIAVEVINHDGDQIPKVYGV